VNPWVVLLISAIVGWSLIFVIASVIVRFRPNLRSTSQILLIAALAIGGYFALRDAGDDPIPARLAGEMFGSALFFVLPVLVAIALETRRRKKAELVP
jgi:hypothetical protein